MLFKSNVDLGKNQLINPVFQQLSSAPGSPTIGQFYFDTVLGALQIYDGSAWINTKITSHSLSELSAPTGDISMASHKLTNLTNGVGAQDAATMANVTAAVDGVITGLQWKDAVRVVYTTNQSLSTAAGTYDGVTLNNGDRVLLTSQTTASQNGPYTWATGGVLTRAGDTAQNNELQEGSTWGVLEGTAGLGTIYRVSTTGAITVGTTSVTIAAVAAGGTYTAGNGLTLTTGAFAISKVAGTNYVPNKIVGTMGDGSTTSIVITDGLGNIDKIAEVRDASTGAKIVCDVTYASTTVTFGFAVAPATNAYKYVIIG